MPASFVVLMEFLYCTTPIVARIVMRAITMSSSMSVKPFWRRNLRFTMPYQSRYFVPSRPLPSDLQ